MERCPKCGQNTLVVLFTSAECENPGCGKTTLTQPELASAIEHNPGMWVMEQTGSVDYIIDTNALPKGDRWARSIFAHTKITHVIAPDGNKYELVRD